MPARGNVVDGLFVLLGLAFLIAPFAAFFMALGARHRLTFLEGRLADLSDRVDRLAPGGAPPGATEARPQPSAPAAREVPPFPPRTLEPPIRPEPIAEQAAPEPQPAIAPSRAE